MCHLGLLHQTVRGQDIAVFQKLKKWNNHTHISQTATLTNNVSVNGYGSHVSPEAVTAKVTTNGDPNQRQSLIGHVSFQPLTQNRQRHLGQVLQALLTNFKSVAKPRGTASPPGLHSCLQASVRTAFSSHSVENETWHQNLKPYQTSQSINNMLTDRREKKWVTGDGTTGCLDKK